MSRLTYALANDWRYLRDGCGLHLLGLEVVLNRMQASVLIRLLGFGIGLTYWKRPAREWEPARSYAWEPIETDGWAGEPRGMEKAP